MPKKAQAQSSPVQLAGEVAINVGGGGGLKKNKRSKSKDATVVNGHAEIAPALKVSIPAITVPGQTRDSLDGGTPTSTVSSGFGTLVHSINEGVAQVVRLPPLDSALLGFDVSGSSENGTVIVQKLDDTVVRESPNLSVDPEMVLKDGHRIVGVHIPLNSCKFEEVVKLLNSVLPFSPEFHVKREHDSLPTSEPIEIVHVGPMPVNDLEPMELLPALPHLDTPDQESDFIEPTFEHDYLFSVADKPDIEHQRLCQWTEPVPAITVEAARGEEEEEEEVMEELVRAKLRPLVQTQRESERLAKISIRSTDSLRSAQKPTQGATVLRQKSREPVKMEAEAELKVPRAVDQLDAAVNVAGMQGVTVVAARPESLGAESGVDVEAEHRHHSKKRQFHKNRDLKRGRSAPELPLDAPDQSELYANIASNLHLPEWPRSNGLEVQEAVRPISNPVQPAETKKEARASRGRRRNRDTVFQHEAEVPSRLVVAVQQPVPPNQPVKVAPQPEETFLPRFTTRTERIKSEYIPLSRRPSLLDRLASKFRRSTSRDPVLLSVKKLEEPLVEHLPASISVEEPVKPVIEEQQIAVCAEHSYSHEHLCSMLTLEDAVVPEDEHVCASFEEPIDTNNNSSDKFLPEENACEIEEEHVQRKTRRRGLHAAALVNHEEPELLSSALEPDAFDAPRIEQEDIQLPPPLPITEPPELVLVEEEPEKIEEVVAEEPELPEVIEYASVKPKAAIVQARRNSESSDEDVPPSYSPNFQRKNTLLKQGKRKGLKHNTEDAAVGCNFDSSDDELEADRVSITSSLISELMGFESESD